MARLHRRECLPTRSNRGGWGQSLLFLLYIHFVDWMRTRFSSWYSTLYVFWSVIFYLYRNLETPYIQRYYIYRVIAFVGCHIRRGPHKPNSPFLFLFLADYIKNQIEYTDCAVALKDAMIYFPLWYSFFFLDWFAFIFHLFCFLLKMKSKYVKICVVVVP